MIALRLGSLLLLAGLTGFSPASRGQSSSQPFDVLLGRPTDRSIAVSVMSTDAREVIVDYGTQSGTYPLQSAPVTLAAGNPAIVSLDGLTADTTYVYRIRHRAVGATSFQNAAEARFVTQRARGRTFTFAVEADPHHLDNEPPVWVAGLANMLSDKPDFLIDLGDTFMDEKYGYSTQAELVKTRIDVRNGFFSTIGHSVPLFLVNGNHDPELGWLLNNTQPQSNLAVWGVQARQKYYPCPIPGGFYSGDGTLDRFTGGPRDAYYAFEWGDALFISLDPFWYSAQATNKSKDPWMWTLGRTQYDWLKRTLEQSKATFRFVFMHHIVGGSFDTLARGGVEFAPYFEWGGKNTDDTAGFAAKRPGWPMPIQDLLLANKVTIVFHGHDHLYIKQDLDVDKDGTPDLIYQEVPQPCRTNQNTSSAAPYGYREGVMYPSSGHLRVTVSPRQVAVEYVRNVVPNDTRAGVANGTVQHRYTIQAPGSAPATPSRLANLSVRAAAGTGNDALIAGFVVAPGNPAPVLVRAAGPALADFGVPGTLADPALTLNAQDGPEIATNDTWDSPDATAIRNAAAQVGAFEFKAGSRDAALLSTLAPGAYSARVTAPAGTTGVALIEAYAQASTGRLINLSARTRAGTGGDVLIAGFSIQGEAPKKVLIRGVGPTLSAFGLTGLLADPQLSLYRTGTALALYQNDNWGTSPNVAPITAAAKSVGAFDLPTTSKDAALLVELDPGTYTAVISGAGNTTGIALVEIYEVP